MNIYAYITIFVILALAATSVGLIYSQHRHKRVSCPSFGPRPLLCFKIGDRGKGVQLRQYGYTKGDRVVVMPLADFTRLKSAARQRTDRNGFALVESFMSAMAHNIELTSIEKRISTIPDEEL